VIIGVAGLNRTKGAIAKIIQVSGLSNGKFPSGLENPSLFGTTGLFGILR